MQSISSENKNEIGITSAMEAVLKGCSHGGCAIYRLQEKAAFVVGGTALMR